MKFSHHVSHITVKNPAVLRVKTIHDMLHEIVSRNRTTLYTAYAAQ